MPFRKLFLVSALLGAVFCYSAEGKEWRQARNKAFQAGEKLNFSIKWGIIKVGSASMEVREVTQYENRDVFRIISTARSSLFFDPFFKVRDRIEVLMDKGSLCSWRFEKSLREGDYTKDELILFDQRGLKAKEGDEIQSVPPYVQDILSAFYYFRTLNVEAGKDYRFPVYTDRKTWEMVVKVTKKEKIKTPAGRFKTIRVEPVMKGQGIFAQKGKIEIWLTDDRYRMPVLMRSKIAVGSIRAILTDYKR